MGKARKASAAASAAAMHRAGFDGSTFVGFDAFAGAAAAPSAPSAPSASQKGGEERAASSFYAGKHEDLKQAFKSLSKKDPQTKVKALQEIARLVADEALAAREDAREALPHFLYHYLRLCGREADHRVRERANATLGVFLERAPKLVARFAGEYLGEALCCMGDATNVDVSRAAVGLLRALGAKTADGGGLAGLLSKYIEPVSTLLADRIANRAAEGVEDETRDRLQASAVGALARLPQIAPEFDVTVVARQTLGRPVRWKPLFNSESAVVRGAAYELVATLAKAGGLDAQVSGEEACALISRALATEPEPRLVGRAVEALVTLMQDAAFFDQVRDYRKGFFPNLWSFLRRGARGAGRLAYPMLLPMLSLIPAQVWEDLGSEELANKLLEEVWSGMAAEDDLGPHGTPALLQAQVECAAYLLKHSRPFAVTHLLRPMEAFICENRRFRLGQNLPGTLALALGQLPADQAESWAAVQQALEGHFLSDATRAGRVVIIVEAAASRRRDGGGRQQAIVALARSIIAASLEDTRRCPSLAALDALVKISGVDADLMDGLMRTARLRRDGAETAASFRLAVRVCTCGPSPANEREEMWALFFAGLEDDARAQAMLADGILDAKATTSDTANAAPLEGLIQSVVGCPIARSVGALRDVGWLDEAAAAALEAKCAAPLARFVAAHFGSAGSAEGDFGVAGAGDGASSTPSDARLENMVGVLSYLPAGARPEIAALALIAKALLEPRAALAPNVPAEVESWLRNWLVRVFGREAKDEIWDERAKHAWAHLAREGARGEAVFTSLHGTEQVTRLVHVAMYVSEEVEEGGCLGFVEPASLLWALLVHAEDQPEWREAVLVPYIVHARFGDFVRAAMHDENLQLRMDAAPVEEVFAYAASSYAALTVQDVETTIKQEVVPAMQGLQLRLPALRTLVRTVSLLLQDAGLAFDELVERCGATILQQVPSGAREEAKSTADVFISVMRGHEEEVEDDVVVEAADSVSAGGAEDANAAVQADALGTTAASEGGNIPSVSAGFRAPKFAEGEEIVYKKSPARTAGVVSKVHMDDPSEPYYTVVLDGREVQTIERYLEAKHHVPETLAELNAMLAQARRAGDHKESLRLMKLLPELTPKPVDSDQQRREALAASKARRQRALEQMAQAQARRREGTASKPGTAPQGAAGGTAGGSESDVGGASGPDGAAGVTGVGLSRALEQFGVLTGSGRGARLGQSELRQLLCVSAVLEAVASPRAVATHLRQPHAKAGAPEFHRMLLAALAVVRSLLENVPSTALPPSLHDYVSRILVACALHGNGDDELLQATMRAAVCMDPEDEDAERIMDKAADLVLAPAEGEGAVPAEALDLLQRAPYSLLLQSETRVRGLLSRIAQPAAGAASQEVAAKLADLVEKGAAEDSGLAKAWWSEREVLLEGLGAAQRAVGDEGGDEREFPVSCWRALVALVREMRGAEAGEREELAQELEDRGLVSLALRWSLLDESARGAPDALRQRVGAHTLRVLPALSRRWFMDSAKVNRAEYARVRALMAKYITPQIVAIEVADIEKANREHAFDAVNDVGQRGQGDGAAAADDGLEDFGQITVRASAGARVVTALYEKEDCSVEMEVRIPSCFPLENVQVECVGQVGISRERWRRWVMQINTLLTSQDGTLLDALLLWKLNMDKELEGMEPCPICYAVVHANDQSFPRLKCSTCKNAYHSRCLVKWFKTSHKNECPMCKQPFEFD